MEREKLRVVIQVVGKKGIQVDRQRGGKGAGVKRMGLLLEFLYVLFPLVNKLFVLVGQQFNGVGKLLYLK